MASPVSIGDIIAIGKLCFNLVDYIKSLKGTSLEYENAVATLTRQTFTCEIIARTFVSGNRHRLAQPGFMAETGDGIAREIQSAQRSLAKAVAVLRARYPSGSSPSGLAGVNRLVGRLRWRNTRLIFERQLEPVDQSLRNIQLLLGMRNESLTSEFSQSIAAIRLEVDRLPLQMGYPGSGGTPKDHVHFNNGLGQSMFLPLNLCSDPENLHQFFEFRFERCPGEKLIQQRRYKLYCDNFRPPVELNVRTWDSLVQPGCHMALAFVVGIYRPSMRNRCPRCHCLSQNAVPMWYQCQCTRSYYASGTRVLGCETESDCPYTITINYPDHQLHERAAASPVCSSSSNTTATAAGRIVRHTSVSRTIDEALENERLFYRSVVIVLDPVVDIIYAGNLFVRYILWVASVTSTLDANHIDKFAVGGCDKHQIVPEQGTDPRDVLGAKCYWDVDRYVRRYSSCRRFAGGCYAQNMTGVADRLIEFESVVVR